MFDASSPRTSGASGRNASRQSTTAPSTSYSIATRAAASSAMWRLSATTTAMASPTNATSRSASTNGVVSSGSAASGNPSGMRQDVNWPNRSRAP
ncbi:Uncharacterised protein [Bordetella pertussis]|nr:Uncharacterised protein [Bordetella pertussis]CFW08914.1 Uncharacterised protein [Bordetella pertussis]CFW45148.1 Uncharacterised protein [Bordetella pertussis]CPJ21080.1 Uncharacterised protein [Bordetella pertussis]CPO78273.1 Uncharacterised protein [Bordetella pertussis]